jgi:hypothetical protein
MTAMPSVDALRTHARDLARSWDVRVIESDELKPEEGRAIRDLRAVLVSTIREETTYAITLHEIGHFAAPLGLVRGVVDGPRGNLLRIEEDAAWTWARHYALIWTPVMDRVARWAENTYAADGPATPSAPVAPKSIDWNDWT